MSGGFFRGTSADQDTRFSNKQAKLLKSQKFAPELDHLVDMSKVKMDVMRPWIANRVTELIGFEDEVLINFIYSLLDGKEVNGKEVQISLTGFMERNTGKFMKELWALLLSAQKNTSGVPQQFLDAKEEETKKKKAESDRIANEIKRKKEREGQELEQERNRKMDVGNDTLKGDNTVKEPARESRARSADEEPKGRNGSRDRSLVTKSPHSADRSSPPRRMRSRSPSKSFSNSRSYSNERHRSRSLSASPKRRRRSSSPEMIRRSSPKRSLTPRRRRSPRRSLTPPRRRSSYSRRRLSPSPTRYRIRSPRRRRSRSPLGRRSRSPIWRSYVRNRSPSPVRRRSPSPGRRRALSPGQRRSPSPVRRRSPYPMRHRSPSPMRKRYRGSPLSPQPRSPSPARRRSPISSRRRSPSPVKSRSRSSHDWSSPSPVKHRSPLPSRRRSPKRQRSPVESHRPRKRDFEEDSPGRHASPRSGAQRRSKSIERSRSDSLDLGTPRKVKAFSPSPLMSSPVPEHESKISINDDARSNGHPRSSADKSNVKISIACSPPRTSREYKPSHSSERSADDKDVDYRREDAKWSYRSKGTSKALDQPKGSRHTDDKDELSPQRLDGSHPAQTHSHTGRTDSNEKKIDPSSDQHHDAMPRLSGKVDQKDQSSFEGSGSEEIDKKRSKVKGRRKNKRPERQRSESEDESSYDSSEEERKEAKRRRKVERRSRKEEKKRRREERRRKKEERRAEKLKLKSIDTVYSHSDAEGIHDNDADGHQNSKRLPSHRKNVEQAEPDHKRLEIELREKALENLRAKKNIH